MRNKLKLIFATAIIIIVVAKGAVAAAIYFYPPIIENTSVEISTKEIIKLTNDYRIDNGLKPLKENPRLNQAAINKAKDLLTKEYFDHTSPDGKKFSEWIKEVNYKYFFVGENLAIDFKTADDTFKGWLNSPKHKDNILKDQYQEIGVAAVKGKYNKRDTIIIVQLFGSRVLSPTMSADSDIYSNEINDYFYIQPWWQKTFSLEYLSKTNVSLNYILALFIALFLLLYEPHLTKNHTNINNPIISRYHAKAFKE